MSRGPKGSALLDGKSTVRWANLWSHGGKFLFENFTASFVFEQERSSLSLGKWAHYPRESELLLIECWRTRKATHPFPTSQVHKCSLQKQSLFFNEKTSLRRELFFNSSIETLLFLSFFLSDSQNTRDYPKMLIFKGGTAISCGHIYACILEIHRNRPEMGV